MGGAAVKNARLRRNRLDGARGSLQAGRVARGMRGQILGPPDFGADEILLVPDFPVRHLVAIAFGRLPDERAPRVEIFMQRQGILPRHVDDGQERKPLPGHQIDGPVDVRELIAMRFRIAPLPGPGNIAADPARAALGDRIEAPADAVVPRAGIDEVIAKTERRRFVRGMGGIGTAALERQSNGKTNQGDMYDRSPFHKPILPSQALFRKGAEVVQLSV